MTRLPSSLLLGLAAVTTAGLVWLAHSRAPSASLPPLATATRPDGQSEAYYAAGDAALTTGLALLNDYWTTLLNENPALARGHVDHYLPPTLKALGYRPADALMAELAETFFAARDPQTGLIPYAYEAELPRDPKAPDAIFTTANKQPVGLIDRAAELCQWSPGDRALQSQCVDLAQSTIDHFDVPQPTTEPTGLWGWVDVTSGAAPRHALTLTQDYGQVALGMVKLAAAKPELRPWADEKLAFVWQHPQSSTLPLLYEQFVLTQGLERPEEPSSDTDTLYFVRQLFELCELTGTPQYCDWAMATTDVWVERAWVPQWGHFIRKLNPDGSRAVDSLYGDGKYNTLYILVQAYRVTGDRAYLDRLQLAWNTLRHLGQDGLAPEMVERGEMVVDQGLDPQQTIFLDILLEAYAASDDPAFLRAADDLGDRILEEGESVMRLESGQAGGALLRLAQARQGIGRLELELPATETQLTLRHRGRTLLQTQVPGKIAIVYLPQGHYTVVAQREGTTHTLPIKLSESIQITVP
ncbi:hypothetical protein PGN35_007490 [Nodosilinea sp. PGN35]|uniref:hypothetical protein n=1 Tax=Nodosilinea sp. PGN35 TaxID=3020489 RepID=UPI0023B2C4C7|nr:hypothetical protein [Nodosilinea sp. TSF1-S3]MDF0367115.1 hypothetical protein [Nodosilinea sp. TSF1-S3]